MAAACRLDRRFGSCGMADRIPGGSLCPVHPIRPRSCRTRSHSTVARSAIEDATSGSVLDCDLAQREDSRHGGRAGLGLCRRGHRRRVTAGSAARGLGPANPAVAARPSGLPPERARHGRHPGVGELAYRSLAPGPGGRARLSWSRSPRPTCLSSTESPHVRVGQCRVYIDWAR